MLLGFLSYSCSGVGSFNVKFRNHLEIPQVNYFDWIISSKTNVLANGSEQNLVDCNRDKTLGNWGCDGGKKTVLIFYETTLDFTFAPICVNSRQHGGSVSLKI